MARPSNHQLRAMLLPAHSLLLSLFNMVMGMFNEVGNEAVCQLFRSEAFTACVRSFCATALEWRMRYSPACQLYATR